jgi:hypothetical protein
MAKVFAENPRPNDLAPTLLDSVDSDDSSPEVRNLSELRLSVAILLPGELQLLALGIITSISVHGSGTPVCALSSSTILRKTGRCNLACGPL